ncbi:unnamed protein product, partial [Mesorhabditis spiculigera]
MLLKVLTLLLWLACQYGVYADSTVDNLISLFQSEATPEEIQRCAFTTSDTLDCQSCIDKGDKCFYCGGDTNQCFPYSASFPHCPLDHVKHKNCWVNWTAIVVIACILAGIVLVAIITVVCCCCCKIRNWNSNRNKAFWNKKEEKQQMKMQDLEARQAERRSQRANEMDYYREKYGIKAKS